MPMRDAETSRIVEQVQGRQGELALREAVDHYEIISNGVFLMDTRNGESERLLMRLALRAGGRLSRLLLGGLGVGFSLAEALRSDRLEHVTVVEIEPKIVEWNRTYLAPYSGNALSDPRVKVVIEDVVAFLNHEREPFDGICLDVDNGPAWTVTSANSMLYADESLALLYERLKPGGILTVWSAAEVQGFAERLRRVFESVETFGVPVPRGEPDFIYAASRL
jgi:spermidine synthase